MFPYSLWMNCRRPEDAIDITSGRPEDAIDIT